MLIAVIVSPVLRKVQSNMFNMFLRMFIVVSPTYFFQDPSTDILETFSRDVTLVEKKATATSVSWKCPWQKWCANPPNFAQCRVEQQHIKRHHS